MSTSMLTLRASLARLRKRLGALYETAWAFSPQPEHLLADTDSGDEISAPEEYPWPLPAHPLFGAALPLCGSTLYPSQHGALLAAVLGSGEEDEWQHRRRVEHRAGPDRKRERGVLLP
ncbi:MAG TPA: hypothetical protein VIC60_07100 [Thermomicrobiales bacterium]